MSVRIERRNGKLVADIITRSPDGKRIRKRANVPSEIRSESAARRWAEARALRLAMDGDEPEREPAPRLRDFADRWMDEFVRANGCKPSTVATRERHLRLHLIPALGDARLDAIGKAEGQRVKVAVGGSAKSQRDVLGTLATILRTAEDWGLIAKAPGFDLPRAAEPEVRFWDFDEWEALVAGAEKAGPMVLAMVLLAGEAGLRRGELVALEQVDVGPAQITVRWNEWEGHKGTPKGGRIRRVPMTERLRVAVARVRHLRGKRLLWQPSGAPVGVPTLQSWLETACRRAGLPESRDLHKLRHTFCSHLAMRGATLPSIKELAGHADIATTMRYAHLSPAHKNEAIRLLERGAGVEQKSAATAVSESVPTEIRTTGRLPPGSGPQRET